METATEIIPIQVDTAGVIRIGGTRVTLDTVVGAFKDGATNELHFDPRGVRTRLLSRRVSVDL